MRIDFEGKSTTLGPNRTHKKFRTTLSEGCGMKSSATKVVSPKSSYENLSSNRGKKHKQWQKITAPGRQTEKRCNPMFIRSSASAEPPRGRRAGTAWKGTGPNPHVKNLRKQRPAQKRIDPGTGSEDVSTSRGILFRHRRGSPG